MSVISTSNNNLTKSYVNGNLDSKTTVNVANIAQTAEVETLQNTIQTIKNQIEELSQKFTAGTMTLEDATTVMYSLLDKLQGLLGSAQQLGDDMLSSIEGIEQSLSSISLPTGLKEILANIFEEIKNAKNNNDINLMQLNNSIEKLELAIQQFATNTANAALDVTNFLQGISQSLAQVADGFGSLADKLNELTSRLQQNQNLTTIAKVVDTVSNVIDAVATAAENIANTISDIGSKISNFFKGWR